MAFQSVRTDNEWCPFLDTMVVVIRKTSIDVQRMTNLERTVEKQVPFFNSIPAHGDVAIR